MPSETRRPADFFRLPEKSGWPAGIRGVRTRALEPRSVRSTAHRMDRSLPSAATRTVPHMPPSVPRRFAAAARIHVPRLVTGAVTCSLYTARRCSDAGAEVARHGERCIDCISINSALKCSGINNTVG
jgi:hypothetical protein